MKKINLIILKIASKFQNSIDLCVSDELEENLCHLQIDFENIQSKIKDTKIKKSHSNFIDSSTLFLQTNCFKIR